MRHPVEDIKGTKSKKLAGTTIVLGVTGSIAAVGTVKLVRELLRHGAEVYPVMTAAAAEIIHPYSLEFASGHTPITRITGKVEHVALAGIDKPMDILLIAPATANTISKLACAIDDTPVTTFATTAIGSGKKVLMVPAMHHSMYLHPIVRENIRKLEGIGVSFLMPKIEENKAKLPSNASIVSWLIRQRNLMSHPERTGKTVLLIGGASSEAVDDVRTITNVSSGNSAVSLATAAFELGYDLTFFYGTSPAVVPGFIQKTDFTGIDDLTKSVRSLSQEKRKFDIVINVAALSDFTPEQHGAKGKIPSQEKELTLTLKQTGKLLPKLRKWFPDAVLVGYKLESGGKVRTSKQELIKKARTLMNDAGCGLVVANELKDVGHDTSSVHILLRGKKSVKGFTGSKDELAEEVFACIEGVSRSGPV